MFDDVDPYDEAPLSPATDHPDPVDRDDDADAVLRVVAAQQRMLNLLGWQQLASAARWADLHGEDAFAAFGESAGRLGGEILAQRGGDGTPVVAEFAPAELAAVLGISAVSAGSLIADALDLRHRFPLLWARLQTGDVKTFVARKVAARTRRLSRAAAAGVDARVTPRVASVPYGRLEKILEAAIVAADPQMAAADARAAADKRGVWRSRDLDAGTATIFGCADAPDVAAFDKSLDTVAQALSLLGDETTLDVRRAKALGVLADPQAALQLVDTAEAARRAGCDAGTAPRRARRCLFGAATLYVHISRDTLQAGDGGVARVEEVGPALLEQVRSWLGDRTVKLQPVLDLDDLPAVDGYEVPERIAEAVRLRTPADCFPYGVNITRHGDLDHTDPYVPLGDGGPPGQTRLDNLGRMTRRHHRIKTHGHWKVSQPRSGVWLWHSPHGYGYLVDAAGTTALGKLGSRPSCPLPSGDGVRAHLSGTASTVKP